MEIITKEVVKLLENGVIQQAIWTEAVQSLGSTKNVMYCQERIDQSKMQNSSVLAFPKEGKQVECIVATNINQQADSFLEDWC